MSGAIQTPVDLLRAALAATPKAWGHTLPNRSMGEPSHPCFWVGRLCVDFQSTMFGLTAGDDWLFLSADVLGPEAPSIVQGLRDEMARFEATESGALARLTAAMCADG